MTIRSAAQAVRPRRRADPLATEVRRRLEWLTRTLGNNELASILGVSASQPSRWRRGIEGIGPDNLTALLALDYIVMRLHEQWVPDVAKTWLRSSNRRLGGGKPVDALRMGAYRDVIDAIDAEAQGAYL